MPVIGFFAFLFFAALFGPTLIALALAFVSLMHAPGMILYISCSIIYGYSRITAMRKVAVFFGITAFFHMLIMAITFYEYADAYPTDYGLMPFPEFYYFFSPVVPALDIIFLLLILGQYIFFGRNFWWGQSPLNTISLRIKQLLLFLLLERILSKITQLVKGIAQERDEPVDDEPVKKIWRKRQ